MYRKTKETDSRLFWAFSVAIGLSACGQGPILTPWSDGHSALTQPEPVENTAGPAEQPLITVTQTSTPGESFHDAETSSVAEPYTSPDQRPPVLYVATPKLKRSFSRSNPLIVSGEVYDDHLLAFFIDDLLVGRRNQSFEHAFWLAPGTNLIDFSAIDFFGHQSQVLREVVFDDTPPIIEFTLPDPSQLALQQEEVFFYGRVVEQNLVDLKVDGQTIPLYQDQFEQRLERASLSPGLHVLRFVATDQAGFVTERSLGLLVDGVKMRFAPDLASAPEKSPHGPENAIGFFVDIAAQSENMDAELVVLGEGEQMERIRLSTLIEGGASPSWKRVYVYFDDLQVVEKVQSVRVESLASDEASPPQALFSKVGFFNKMDAPISLSSDAEPPFLEVKNLVHPVTYTNVPFATVTGSVSDENLMFVRINQLVVTQKNGAFSSIVRLNENKNDFVVVARDLVGLENQVSRSIVFDQEVPKISLDGPLKETVFDRAYTLSGRVMEPHLRRLTILEPTASSTKALTTDELGGFKTLVQLQDGLNVLELTATDLAHNQVTTTLEITYKDLYQLEKPTMPPTDLIGHSVGKRVKLQWQPPKRLVDGSSIPRGLTTRFRVYRDDVQISNDGSADLDTPSFADEVETLDRVYRYYVTAVLFDQGGQAIESSASNILKVEVGFQRPVTAPGQFEAPSPATRGQRAVVLPQTAVSEVGGKLVAHLVYVVPGRQGQGDQLLYVRSQKAGKPHSFSEPAVLQGSKPGRAITDLTLDAKAHKLAIGWIEKDGREDTQTTGSQLWVVESDRAGAHFKEARLVHDTPAWKRGLDLGYDRFHNLHLVWGESNKAYYLKNLEGTPESVFDRRYRTKNDIVVDYYRVYRQKCEDTSPPCGCNDMPNERYSYGLENNRKTNEPFGPYLERVEEAWVYQPSLHIDNERISIVARQNRMWDDKPLRNPEWTGEYGPLAPPLDKKVTSRDGSTRTHWCPEEGAGRAQMGFLQVYEYRAKGGRPQARTRLSEEERARRRDLESGNENAYTYYHGEGNQTFFSYDPNVRHEKNWYFYLHDGTWHEEDQIKVAQRPVVEGAWSEPATATVEVSNWPIERGLLTWHEEEQTVETGWRQGTWVDGRFESWRISVVATLEKEAEQDQTHSYPRIYTGPDGTQFVVYETGSSSNPNVAGHNPIMVQHSIAGGTWSAPHHIAFGYLPDLGVTKEGEVGVLYYVPKTDDEGVIQIRRSQSAGRSWTDAEVLSPFPAKPIHFKSHAQAADTLAGVPSLTTHENLFLATWVRPAQGQDGQERVIITRSSREGTASRIDTELPTQVRAGHAARVHVTVENKYHQQLDVDTSVRLGSNGASPSPSGLQAFLHDGTPNASTEDDGGVDIEIQGGQATAYVGLFGNTGSGATQSGHDVDQVNLKGQDGLEHHASTSVLPTYLTGNHLWATRLRDGLIRYSEAPSASDSEGTSMDEDSRVYYQVEYQPDLSDPGALRLRDPAFWESLGVEAQQVAHIINDPEHQDGKYLAGFDRVWAYTMGIALAQQARTPGPEAKKIARGMARWLCTHAETGEWQGRTIIRGWHFSENTNNDSWKDARLVTGANAWAVQGIGVFVSSAAFEEASASEQTKLRTCYLQALEGLKRHRHDDVVAPDGTRVTLMTAGETTKGLQSARSPHELRLDMTPPVRPNEEWAYYDVLDAVGYQAYNEDQKPNIRVSLRQADGSLLDGGIRTLSLEEWEALKEPALAQNVVTEHNLDVLSVLNHAIKNASKLGLEDQLDELQTWRTDLRNGTFKALWSDKPLHVEKEANGCREARVIDSPSRVITGGLLRGESLEANEESAIDNCSWLSLSVDYRASDFPDEYVEKMAICLDYTIDHFADDLKTNGTCYRGTHYFPNSFKDPYIDQTDLQEASYHLEATTGLILGLLVFVHEHPEHPRSEAFRQEALHLWAGVQSYVQSEGFPYSSQRIQDLSTLLTSSTALIWYIDVYDYIERTENDLDRPLVNYAQGTDLNRTTDWVVDAWSKLTAMEWDKGPTNTAFQIHGSDQNLTWGSADPASGENQIYAAPAQTPKQKSPMLGHPGYEDEPVDFSNSAPVNAANISVEAWVEKRPLEGLGSLLPSSYFYDFYYVFRGDVTGIEIGPELGVLLSIRQEGRELFVKDVPLDESGHFETALKQEDAVVFLGDAHRFTLSTKIARLRRGSGEILATTGGPTSIQNATSAHAVYQPTPRYSGKKGEWFIHGADSETFELKDHAQNTIAAAHAKDLALLVSGYTKSDQEGARPITRTEDQALAVLAAVHRGDLEQAWAWGWALKRVTQTVFHPENPLALIPYAVDAETGVAVAPYYQTGSQMMALYALATLHRALEPVHPARAQTLAEHILKLQQSMRTAYFHQEAGHPLEGFFQSGNGFPEAWAKALEGNAEEPHPEDVSLPVFASASLRDHVYAYFAFARAAEVLPDPKGRALAKDLKRSVEDKLENAFWQDDRPLRFIQDPSDEQKVDATEDSIGMHALYTLFALERGLVRRAHLSLDRLAGLTHALKDTWADGKGFDFSNSFALVVLAERGGARIDPRLEQLAWSRLETLLSASAGPGSMAAMLLAEHPKDLFGVTASPVAFVRSPSALHWEERVQRRIEQQGLDTLLSLFLSPYRPQSFDTGMNRMVQLVALAEALHEGVPVERWRSFYREETYSHRVAYTVWALQNLCESRNQGALTGLDLNRSLGLSCEAASAHFKALLVARTGTSEDPSRLAALIEHPHDAFELTQRIYQLTRDDVPSPHSYGDSLHGNTQIVQAPKGPVSFDFIREADPVELSADLSVAQRKEQLQTHWQTTLQDALLEQRHLGRTPWFEVEGINFIGLGNKASLEASGRKALEYLVLQGPEHQTRYALGGIPTREPLPEAWKMLEPGVGVIGSAEATNAGHLRRFINAEAGGQLPKLARQAGLDPSIVHRAMRSGLLLETHLMSMMNAVGLSQEKADAYKAGFTFVEPNDPRVHISATGTPKNELALHQVGLATAILDPVNPSVGTELATPKNPRVHFVLPASEEVGNTELPGKEVCYEVFRFDAQTLSPEDFLALSVEEAEQHRIDACAKASPYEDLGLLEAYFQRAPTQDRFDPMYAVVLSTPQTRSFLSGYVQLPQIPSVFPRAYRRPLVGGKASPGPGIPDSDPTIEENALVIDMAILYTASAVRESGGVDALNEDIDRIVGAANQALLDMDSSVRIVAHTAYTTYQEIGDVRLDAADIQAHAPQSILSPYLGFKADLLTVLTRSGLGGSTEGPTEHRVTSPHGTWVHTRLHPGTLAAVHDQSGRGAMGVQEVGEFQTLGRFNELVYFLLGCRALGEDERCAPLLEATAAATRNVDGQMHRVADYLVQSASGLGLPAPIPAISKHSPCADVPLENTGDHNIVWSARSDSSWLNILLDGQPAETLGVPERTLVPRASSMLRVCGGIPGFPESAFSPPQKVITLEFINQTDGGLIETRVLHFPDAEERPNEPRKQPLGATQAHADDDTFGHAPSSEDLDEQTREDIKRIVDAHSPLNVPLVKEVIGRSAMFNWLQRQLPDRGLKMKWTDGPTGFVPGTVGKQIVLISERHALNPERLIGHIAHELTHRIAHNHPLFHQQTEDQVYACADGSGTCTLAGWSRAALSEKAWREAHFNAWVRAEAQSVFYEMVVLKEIRSFLEKTGDTRYALDRLYLSGTRLEAYEAIVDAFWPFRGAEPYQQELDAREEAIQKLKRLVHVAVGSGGQSYRTRFTQKINAVWGYGTEDARAQTVINLRFQEGAHHPDDREHYQGTLRAQYNDFSTDLVPGKVYDGQSFVDDLIFVAIHNENRPTVNVAPESGNSLEGLASDGRLPRGLFIDPDFWEELEDHGIYSLADYLERLHEEERLYADEETKETLDNIDLSQCYTNPDCPVIQILLEYEDDQGDQAVAFSVHYPYEGNGEAIPITLLDLLGLAPIPVAKVGAVLGTAALAGLGFVKVASTTAPKFASATKISLGRTGNIFTVPLKRPISSEVSTNPTIHFLSRQEARKGFTGGLRTSANQFYRHAKDKGQHFRTEKLPDGNYRFEFFHAANNPGYGKRYIKVVDPTGTTLKSYKETIGPKGLLETKWLVGGPD